MVVCIMNTPIQELATMTETEKLYRINERLEDFHISCFDFNAAMMDKWRMLVWQGGNH